MKNYRVAPLVILIALSFLMLASCKNKDQKLSSEASYIKAYELLKDKSYAEAAKEFEKLDDDFPFSKWAIKGQTMATYAHHKSDEPDKVIQLAEDFLRLHTNSEYAPYMLYMKGLSYYNRIPSIDRAQDETQKASYSFRELIVRFPEDVHAKDAAEKLGFVDEHLAGAKMAVGRYQIETKNFVGAIKNFDEVCLRYRSTKQVAEAYYRLFEIYQKIGLASQAKKAKQYLEQNFPKSYWAELLSN